MGRNIDAGENMTAPTRALLVAHNGGLFGAERSTLTLAQGLMTQQGFEVLVLVPFEGPMAHRCRAQGLPVHVHTYRQWIGLGAGGPRAAAKRQLRNLLALRRLLPVARGFAPDIVYTATGTTPVGAALARRLGAAHVWHLRELPEEQFATGYDWGRRLTYRYMARHAQRLIANSEDVAKVFSRHLGRGDIEVVYNGFEFSGAPFLDAQAKYRQCVEGAPSITLLVLGALSPAKDQEMAVRACAALARRGWRLRLTLAGDGDPAYRDGLRGLARQLGIEASLSMPGFVEDPDPLIAEAAITLVCSRNEAFGRTAVESLAAGTPVIGTRAGGLREILEPGDLGPLVAPGDWRGLAEQIQRLLRDPASYERIAAAGPAAMRQRFSQRRYVAEVARVLRGAYGQSDLVPAASRFVQQTRG